MDINTFSKQLSNYLWRHSFFELMSALGYTPNPEDLYQSALWMTINSLNTALAKLDKETQQKLVAAITPSTNN